MTFTGLTVKRTALAFRVYPIIKMCCSSVVLLVYFKQLGKKKLASPAIMQGSEHRSWSWEITVL
jgi:hypothetical protein